jgi:hypothetical protein
MFTMSENTTYQAQTSFAADFLASHTVQPGSEKARQMTAISGRNISALLTNVDPLGLLVKTCLVSEQPYSTKCYLTWRVWTTPQSRLIFRLAASMPPTSENEYSLLPTPKAARGTYQYQAGSRKKNYTLEGLARTGMLPTPIAGDIKSQDHHNRNKSLYGLAGGPLNPEFVEWLMGFPIGWTELDHSETP